jgi:hypothetical protein
MYLMSMELYKTVNKTEGVTPGRVVIITSRNDIAGNATKLSCNQHSIHRATQSLSILMESRKCDPYVFSHLLFPRGHIHSQPGHAAAFTRVSE